MLLKRKPLSLKFGNFVVVADIFYTNDKIYVIGVNYKELEENTLTSVRKAFDLKFELDGRKCEHTNISAEYGSADRFLIFLISNQSGMDSKVFGIEFEGAMYFFNLNSKDHFLEEKVVAELSMMTLFKGDYQLIPAYVQHYYDLGVSHFSLYYNGQLNNLLTCPKAKEIFDELENNKNINVTLVEWNYPYWFKDEGYTIHSIAQMLALVDMLYRSKLSFPYVFFNDLDEFCFLEDCYEGRLINIIRQHVMIDCFQFNMYWSQYLKCKDNNNLSVNDFQTISYADFNEDFDINNFEKLDYFINDDWRTKCILKTSSIFGLNPHRPKPFYEKTYKNMKEKINLQLKTLCLDGFYHLANIEEKIRKSFIRK